MNYLVSLFLQIMINFLYIISTSLNSTTTPITMIKLWHSILEH